MPGTWSAPPSGPSCGAPPADRYQRGHWIGATVVLCSSLLLNRPLQKEEALGSEVSFLGALDWFAGIPRLLSHLPSTQDFRFGAVPRDSHFALGRKGGPMPPKNPNHLRTTSGKESGCGEGRRVPGEQRKKGIEAGIKRATRPCSFGLIEK